jgi:hypothetical protein
MWSWHRNRRFFQKASGILILRDKHFDLPSQLGVSAAGFGEEGSASFWRSLQCSVEDLLCPPPKLLLHS